MTFFCWVRIYILVFMQNQALLELFHGHSEILVCNDTYQFKDYSVYEASKFDEAHKARVRATQFPIDVQKAYDLGIRLATGQMLLAIEFIRLG